MSYLAGALGSPIHAMFVRSGTRIFIKLLRMRL
ncbi:hypothetical protein Poly21_35480 [Allorhodopirellula heiligendammensis]|uniref:Uncharacterized protein n=1 Tax=Allorhodopirellula heiligendammensis TaxID=2714739 RepID=A0A5C6BVP0_9BACT|nr:hypothetical protein Poly21_35480 [Allorhodopirellula heiligendammensis]